MTDHDQILAAVRATGRRITPQRRIVLDVIEASSEHLDAEGVFRRARAKDPRISLATVYRTLHALTAMGLVDQNHITRTHDRERYEPVGALSHHHFVCVCCQRVIEFRSPDLIRAIDHLQEELSVQVSHACVCLEGYCRDCAPKHDAARR